MKVQLGLLNTNQRPIDPGDAARLLGPYAACPCDIAGELIDGPILLAYRGDRITYEEDYESQPLAFGPFAMTWDGRLDNRKEVADHARLNHIENIPDPEIVLRAYTNRGDSILEDLVGEFSLVIWHKRAQRLQFVRSACGARTLYYAFTKDGLAWCSDFAHLVRVSGVDLKVNDEYVLDYFVCEPDSKQTPLSGIQAAPPNRVLTFENGVFSGSRELWDPTKIRPLTYRTDDEYEQACREQIRNAVSVRLRSRLPIYAELSGGLDSSTIVLTADQILDELNAPRSSLHTVSCVYSESQTCDEADFILAVTQKRSIETHLISEQDQRITLGLEEHPPFTGLPNPLHCMPGRYEAITKTMSEQGARVLFTGIGGDHLFLSEADGAPVVADQIWQAQLFKAHRECKLWSRTTCVPYYQTAKKAVRSAARSVFGGDMLYKELKIPTWINSQKRVPLSPPVDFHLYKRWHSSPGLRTRVYLLDRLYHVVGCGFLNEYHQLYVSHPFSHRPLIEFCLGTPISQFLRNGQTRSLLRRAMRPLLPEKTSKRVSKGLMDETILRAVRREWFTIGDVNNWQVCQRGYVMNAELETTLNRVRLGFLDLSGALFRLFSLERWLRSLNQAQQPTTSSASSIARPFCLDFGVAAKLRTCSVNGGEKEAV